ncbi:MAG TPA: hypothetical protein VFE98_00290 [Candidatus Bathyarchaeia archaeon]|nr:hypothetical protein [Candidatus Bathyarchaeia archaeon]
MVQLDLKRLANFRYAVISLVDNDGFPFSAATDFQITPKGEILLKKPGSRPDLKCKKVGVLFNSITAIPTVGYGDRRYMLVWGTTSEERGMYKLNPERLSEWDEKILPFDQLCARAAPQGAKYLASLQSSVEA